MPRSQDGPVAQTLYVLTDRRLPAGRALEQGIEIYGDRQLAESRLRTVLCDEPSWRGSIELLKLAVIRPRADRESVGLS